VKDVSGGALPGVTVTVTSETTRAAVDAITNGDGVYTATPLVSGSYRVAAALDGFEAAPQVVTIGTGEARADITMAPSRLTESVVVTARRVEEAVQEVPIPVSVIKGDLVADAGAFNVNSTNSSTTVKFRSWDNAGNVEATQTQVVEAPADATPRAGASARALR
jgi:hypothetical protein